MIHQFEQDKAFLEKYLDYEESFLKAQNRIILDDEGQPQVMNQMQEDFLRILQGAILLSQKGEDYIHFQAMYRAGTSDNSTPPGTSNFELINME